MKLFTLVLALPATVGATNFHVAPDGNDGNTGAEGAPFASIQQAANVAAAGDTIIVHAGTYRETVTFSTAGTQASPITLQPAGWPDHPDAVTISGFDVVEVPWHHESGSVYRAELGNAAGVRIGRNMVLLDGEVQREATWPNLPEVVDFQWDHWASAEAGTHDDGTAGPQPNYNGTWVDATYTDDELPPAFESAAIGGAFALFVPEVGSSDSSGIISDIDGTTIEMRIPSPSAGNKEPSGSDPYFLWNALVFLDQPGEAFFDTEGVSGPEGALYVWSDSAPSAGQVEYRARQDGIVLAAPHITVQGIHLLGADVECGGTASNATLNQLTMDHSAHAIDTNFGLARHITVFGADVTIQNCTLRNAWGAGIESRGDNTVIENCIITNCSVQGIRMWESTGGAIRRCTICKTGGANIVLNGSGTDIHHNHLYAAGKLLTDQAAISTLFSGDLEGASIHHNWVHGNRARVNQSLRWLGGRGIRFNGRNSHFTVHHNVIWDLSSRGGLTIWSVEDGFPNTADAKIEVYNNTILADTILQNTSGRTGHLEGITFRNNIWDNLTTAPSGTLVGTPVAENNLFLHADPTPNWPNNSFQGIEFVSGPTGNFYPRQTSTKLDTATIIPGITDGFQGAAPEHGALEFEGENGAPWMAGAELLGDHLGFLSLAQLRSPAGQDYLRVTGFPQGRVPADELALKIGATVFDQWRLVFDQITDSARVYFPVDLTGLDGPQTVEWALDGVSFVAVDSEITINTSANFTLVSVSPTTSEEAGGNTHTITGTGFTDESLYRLPITPSRGADDLDLNARPLACIVDTATPINRGLMKADGGDIRFHRWPDNLPFRYYVESGLNTESTVIWALHENNGLLTRFSHLDESHFYLTYGNDSLSSESDPTVITDRYEALSFPSLRLWLSANSMTDLAPGNLVSTWPDLSGNDKHAVALQDSRRPELKSDGVGGLRTLGFAHEDFLECGTLYDTTPGTMSYVIVYQPLASADPTSRLISANQGANESFSDRPAADAIAGASPHVLSPRRPGRATERFSLGRRATKNQKNFHGDISEILFFDAHIDSNCWIELREYVHRKYGLEGEAQGLSDPAHTIAPLQVSVGGVPATNIVVVSSTEVQFDAPGHPSGSLQSLTVSQTGGELTLPDAIEYIDNSIADPIFLTDVQVAGIEVAVTVTGLDPEESYELQRSLDGQTFATVATLNNPPGTTETLTDPGRPAEAPTVLYRVRQVP